MSIINKSDLVNNVSVRTGLTQKETKKVVDALFDEIRQEVKDGYKVEIRDFGSFQSAERPARKGHNPATGAVVEIPASTRVKFKAGKLFVDMLNR